MKAWINNKEITFDKEVTILEAARSIGEFIPTLCAFLPLDHTPGTCRVCLVDVERSNGQKLTITSCTTPLEEGMRVNTSSPHVREMQRQQVELLFADHEQDCVTCSRHGDCELLELAHRLGVKSAHYSGKFTAQRPRDYSSLSLSRDVNKCVRCLRCVEVCRQVQGIGALNMENIGVSSGVGITGGTNSWVQSSLCVSCGQCTVVCPTGALSEHDSVDGALEILEDSTVIKVIQFAPAVRATLGEAFGLPPGTNVEGKIISALRHIGADYVLDTNFAADVVIMEEGTELLSRFKEKSTSILPMFTSCCPAWINFVELHKPELIPYVSTTRSPQAVLGALAKSYLPEKIGESAKKIRVISVMPCTAKKDEAHREQLGTEEYPDVDMVLTVRELARLLQGRGVELAELEDGNFDTPFMSEGSGAGVIFGASGGVAEAAARTLHFVTTGKELSELGYRASTNPHVLKEAVLSLGDLGELRIAVVHGLANAQAVADEVLEGKSPYHFIEVMSCPGGCVDGGGTLHCKGEYLKRRQLRSETLFELDRQAPVRQSHNNPQIKSLYTEYLSEPNSEKAHHLLHTFYINRKKTKKAPDIRKIWGRIKLG